MSVETSAGTLIAVSAAAPATRNAAGYAAIAGWTPVGEIVDPGEFGRKYALITHNPVATRGTQKKKGSFNEGSMAMQMGLDNDDAGQVLMKSAADDDAPYSFRITLPTGHIYYFQALVMEFVISGLTVDSITAASAAIEITTDNAGIGIVEVPAP